MKKEPILIAKTIEIINNIKEKHCPISKFTISTIVDNNNDQIKYIGNGFCLALKSYCKENKADKIIKKAKSNMSNTTLSKGNGILQEEDCDTYFYNYSKKVITEVTSWKIVKKYFSDKTKTSHIIANNKYVFDTKVFNNLYSLLRNSTYNFVICSNNKNNTKSLVFLLNTVPVAVLLSVKEDPEHLLNMDEK
jgi:hypothetical protein